MRYCTVCKKKFFKGDGTLFRVPRFDKQRKRWSELCGVYLSASATLCEDHFLSSSIVRVGGIVALTPHAEPILHVGLISCALCQKKLHAHTGKHFQVPEDKYRRNLWSESCGVQLTPYSVICQDHFDPLSIIYLEKKLTLLPNALPLPLSISCALCQKKFHANTRKRFKVPEDNYRRNLWSESCGVQLMPYNVICQDHFDPLSIINFKNQLTLLPNALPLPLPPPRLSKEKIEANIPSKEFVIDDDNRSEISVNVPISSSCLLLEDPLNLNKSSFMEQDEVQYVDKEIQTDPIYIGYDAQKCRQLESEIKDLKLQLTRTNLAMNTLYKIFTEGQIRKLMSPAGINWRDHDMENAFQLYKCGTRAYKYLYKKGFPLPHISSLQRWRRKVKNNKNNTTKDNTSVQPNKTNNEEDNNETNNEEDNNETNNETNNEEPNNEEANNEEANNEEANDEEDDDELYNDEEYYDEEDNDEEANDFSGDDNDWFDEFYEEEAASDEKMCKKNNYVISDKSVRIGKPAQQENLTAVVNKKQEHRNTIVIPDLNASILRQHLSEDLSAIISACNGKVFIAKKPLELEKSKEHNSIVGDESQSKCLAFKAATATSTRTQRDMPDLNCMPTAGNIAETIDGVTDEHGSKEEQNVIQQNQDNLLDYNKFLNTLNSGGFLLDET